MNWNSSVNQSIKAKLVGREVIQNCGEMMFQLERSEEFRDELLELFYGHIDYDQMAENLLYELNDEDLAQVLGELGVEEYNDITEPTEFIDTAVNLGVAYEPEPVYCEPYEFWIVNDWFGEKLAEKGAIVEEFMGFTIWGRETSGQAILLDGIISRIAEDMQILEGMENSWENIS